MARSVRETLTAKSQQDKPARPVSMFSGAKHLRAIDAMERSFAAPSVRCCILDTPEALDIGKGGDLMPPEPGIYMPQVIRCDGPHTVSRTKEGVFAPGGDRSFPMGRHDRRSDPTDGAVLHCELHVSSRPTRRNAMRWPAKSGHDDVIGRRIDGRGHHGRLRLEAVLREA